MFKTKLSVSDQYIFTYKLLITLKKFFKKFIYTKAYLIMFNYVI